MSRDRSAAHRFAARLMHGYGVVLRAIAGIVLLVVATVGISVIAVYPLWFLATHAAGAYTAVVGVSLLLLFAALAALKLRRLMNSAQRGELPRRFVLRRLLTSAFVAAAFLLAYTAAVLVVRGSYFAATIVGALLLLTIGLPAGRAAGIDADSTH